MLDYPKNAKSDAMCQGLLELLYGNGFEKVKGIAGLISSMK